MKRWPWRRWGKEEGERESSSWKCGEVKLVWRVFSEWRLVKEREKKEKEEGKERGEKGKGMAR